MPYASSMPPLDLERSTRSSYSLGAVARLTGLSDETGSERWGRLYANWARLDAWIGAAGAPGSAG